MQRRSKSQNKYIITSLNNLVIPIYLGVIKEERKRQQKISITFKIFQQADKNFCYNDNSNEYICYAKLAEIIERFCQENEFKLLEYLCVQIHKLIKSEIGISTPLYVAVEKLDPKIPSSQCTAKCEFSDL